MALHVGVELAEGPGHRDAGGLALLPEGFQGQGEVGAGQGGVAAEAAGGADMVGLALDPGIRIAHRAGNAGAQRDGAAGFHQAGRLFDVDFEVGTHGGRVDEAFAGRQRLRVAAAIADVVG